MGTIQQKYKANENTSRHNPKKNKKQTINKKLSKDLMQRGLMVTKWNNKEDLRQKSYHLHKLASDRGALSMMCRRDEEPRPNVATC